MNINLYNVLKKVGATPVEAERAVADIPSSKEVATKSDIKDMATKEDVERMGRVIVMWVVSVGVVVMGVLISVLK